MENPAKFISQVRAEVGRITWPTRREVITTTIMVLIMASLASIFFFLVDLGIKSGLAALLGRDDQIELPLFLILLGAVACGILIGFFWEWAREHKHRSAARQGSRQVTQLERELAVLKDSTSTPPRDEILALLDKPKAR